VTAEAPGLGTVKAGDTIGAIAAIGVFDAGAGVGASGAPADGRCRLLSLLRNCIQKYRPITATAISDKVARTIGKNLFESLAGLT
jgi:hypothetical protein